MTGDDGKPTRLPASMAPHLFNARFERVDHRSNRGRVYRVTLRDCVRYLKTHPTDPAVSLQRERDVMLWLAPRRRVPEVIAHAREDQTEYLLLRELAGRTFIDPVIDADSMQLARSFAKALRAFHSIDVTGCPFDRRLSVTLPEAAQLIAPTPLDEQLRTNPPPEEELVFSHGDFCLPNVLIDDVGEFGYIDLARAGVADRYLDLACAAQTLRYNEHGEEAVAEFFFAYDLSPLDLDKLRFYTLLNQIL